MAHKIKLKNVFRRGLDGLFCFQSFLATMLIVLLSCVKGVAPQSDSLGDSAMVPPMDRVIAEVMLNKTQQRLANITTQRVSRKAMGQATVVQAALGVNQEKTEVVSSRADGRIEKLFIKETGQRVKKGQPLYSLYSESLLTLQQEYLLASDQADLLGSTETRYTSFAKAAEQKLLLFGLSSDQVARLRQSRTIQQQVTFLSPADGMVTKINVIEGEYIAEGKNLYTLEDLSTLWVEAELYPDESAWVQIGDTFTVKVNGFESVPGHSVVDFLSPEYRSNTQIIVLRGTLKNDDLQLQPGMQAQVVLERSQGKTLVIPVDAVIRDWNGAHVYVQSNTHTFRPRMVKTGLEDFEQVEITAGLNEQDTVAVTGAFLLYSEFVLKKGADPMAGHHH